jgi:hypothetical protein
MIDQADRLESNPMPTNRKRTPRSRKVSSLTIGERNFLLDQNEPLDDPWDDPCWLTDKQRQELWERNREWVLQWWEENKPAGTRPPAEKLFKS